MNKTPNQKNRVVVGLSGGVDSSVAAFLCQQAGYEVIGLFMKNWHDEGVTLSKECPWLEDSQDALRVAENLGIPFQTVDLSNEYKERIVDYMFREYESGRTPNPDVLCNREIKYDVFLKKALELGADYIATGHYCRKEETIVNGEPIYRLLSGKDANKDQSYFLCQLNQDQLAHALFPIGHMQKSEVREIAHNLGLHNAEKKDSQGLCFIGKVSLPDFLQQQLLPKRGPVIKLPSDHNYFKRSEDRNEEIVTNVLSDHSWMPSDGQIIGEHQGAHYYTIGQRKGLGIGGSQEGLYVAELNTKENIIFVAEGDQHPALYSKGLFISAKDEHWIREDLKLKTGEQRVIDLRIRYRQKLFPATLMKTTEGLIIIFEKAQKAVTPGQFAAWYEGEELIGSGIISLRD